MTNILSNIKEFYSYYHTSATLFPERPEECVIKSRLCNRTDFAYASFDALLLGISNVALSIISGLALIATLNRHPKFKVLLDKNLNEAVVHGLSIPISIIGILFPSIINQKFLNLKPIELNKTINSNSALSQVVKYTGSLVFRKRWQYS